VVDEFKQSNDALNIYTNKGSSDNVKDLGILAGPDPVYDFKWTSDHENNITLTEESISQILHHVSDVLFVGITEKAFNDLDELKIYLSENAILSYEVFDQLMISLKEKGVTFNDIDSLILYLQEEGIAPHEEQDTTITITDTAIRRHIDKFQTFPTFDLSQIQKPQVSLFLCKPDRTIVSKLKEAYEVNLNIKALQVNELSFRLPLKIDRQNTLIDNPNISLIRYRYLIKLVLTNPGTSNQYVEYFIVSTPKSEASEDSDSKSFTCLSLISELSDRVINGYNVNSFTLNQIFNGGYDEVTKLQMNGILTGTNWNLATPGGISNKLTFRRRSINISGETTLLNVILNTLVETYNILPIFDTQNRTIYIYSPEEIGKSIDDNILRISYKKYLQSMDLTEEDSEFTTRLRARGKDNLGLQSITPTGQPYLENFSYFMQGFEQDELGNVITSSPYWSDDLCQAQLAYEQKLSDYTGVFTQLLEDKAELELDLAELNIAAFNSLTSLYFVQDVLDVLHGLDKGMHRFRNIYDETIVTPQPIGYSGELNLAWKYYLMIKVESLTDLQVFLAQQSETGDPMIDDITALLSENNWHHNTIIKISGKQMVGIRFEGATNQNISVDICRISDQEFLEDGAREIQIVFLGSASDATWKLGRPDPSDAANTLWTGDLAYNIIEADLQAALAALFSEPDIRVTKQGSMAEGNVYFEISFPYSLATESGLIADFSLLPEDSTSFILQKQKRITLLDKYNEDLKQQEYNSALALVNNKIDEIKVIDDAIQVIRVDLALETNFVTIIDKVELFSFPSSLELITIRLEYPFIPSTDIKVYNIINEDETKEITEGVLQQGFQQIEINPITANLEMSDDNYYWIEIHYSYTSQKLIEERNNFIIEKTYSNENIIYTQDLLEAATEYLEAINEPSLLLNLQLINFMEIAEAHHDFDKLFYNPLMTGLYDMIVVRNEIHNVNVSCMILEISYNFDSSEISFSVSNVRELLDPESQFLKSLNTSTSAAATVLTDKYKWDGASDKATELDNILNSAWDAARQAINSGVDNSVVIDRRGIRVTDPNDPMHVIAIVAGWIGISRDGGNNYSTAINADGIYAKELVGQIILAAQLYIINHAGNIEIGENGILVYDQTGTKRVHIGDLGDFDDPDYIAGTDYGFYFKGQTNPTTGQEHYLEWDGTQLHIGGNLEAVTGTFQDLIAGRTDISYMHLYEHALEPHMDFYANTIKRMGLEKDVIKFYDNDEQYTGYIKAWYDAELGQDRSVLDIGSNDIGVLRSYRVDAEVQRNSSLQTNIYPNVVTTLSATDFLADYESYLQLSDTIELFSDGDIAIGSDAGKIDIESIVDNINVKALNGIINILSNAGINIGKSTGAFISVDNINNDIVMSSDNFTTANAVTSVTSTNIQLNGIVGIAQINSADPTRRYVIQKNGTSGTGIINFICP